MAAIERPRNVVVVLLDSLNRHLIGPYGAAELDTPNLDRLAARSVRFDRHVTGSLPCMPARHDLLTGSLDFLWRPWGSIELWEEPVTHHLRRAGVTTMLVSDHPHLFETGGENYHCEFTAWDYVRGHEGDPWRTCVDPSWVGAPDQPAPAQAGWLRHPYDDSRTWFRDESDYPGPKTMAAAADWLKRQAPSADRYLLFVDEFDPHEPFDTPARWAEMYDPDDSPRPIWPPYATEATARGVISPADLGRVRAAYGAKLSMIDHHLGRLLDVLDRHGAWDDTAFVLCTDHGHYLGEHDIVGKPAAPLYDVMSRIPMLVAWPGLAPARVDALTTTVDLHATLCDVFGVSPTHRTHGRSIVPLLDGSATSIREWALMGIWGREVHVTDGRTKYARAPESINAPLSMWSNRWSTMPVHALPDVRLPKPDGRAFLDTMPGSGVPVIRQPFAAGDPVPFWAASRFTGNHLWDVDEDPDETHDLAGADARREREALDRLRAALDEVEAPDDQYARLGVA
ncbi:MAG: sulfatase [Ilumatobacteraceae bacterium]